MCSCRNDDDANDSENEKNDKENQLNQTQPGELNPEKDQNQRIFQSSTDNENSNANVFDHDNDEQNNVKKRKTG